MQTIPPCPVPIAIDGSIEQPLSYYNVDDHEVWKALFLKQQAILQTTVCSEFLDGLKHLAHRRFTVGWFVRKHHQMDYLEEPDLFHDLFGHVPLLTHQFYSDIMQLVGIQGLEIMKRFSHDNEMRETISNALLRLYWFTIEFGLIKNAQNELKVYGAGIASSSKEVPHALYDKTVLRLEFNQPEQLEYIVRTRYFINDVQKIYFVIPDFQFLYTIFQQDNLIEQIVMAREKGLLNPDEIQALWPI
jgi:phenylalanine-4-hydroxylase